MIGTAALEPWDRILQHHENIVFSVFTSSSFGPSFLVLLVTLFLTFQPVPWKCIFCCVCQAKIKIPAWILLLINCMGKNPLIGCRSCQWAPDWKPLVIKPLVLSLGVSRHPRTHCGQAQWSVSLGGGQCGTAAGD